MSEIVIDLNDNPKIDLETVDVGVADDRLSFTVQGTIRDVEDEILQTVADEQLIPMEIRFKIDES